AARALADTTSILLRVLYPIVPHITWQLWRDLGFAERDGDLLDAAWPQVDEAALLADAIEFVLQVNGTLRGARKAPSSAAEAEIEQAPLAHAAVARCLEGRPAKRVVVVPGNLVNVVG